MLGREHLIAGEGRGLGEGRGTQVATQAAELLPEFAATLEVGVVQCRIRLFEPVVREGLAREDGKGLRRRQGLAGLGAGGEPVADEDKGGLQTVWLIGRRLGPAQPLGLAQNLPQSFAVPRPVTGQAGDGRSRCLHAPKDDVQGIHMGQQGAALGLEQGSDQGGEGIECPAGTLEQLGLGGCQWIAGTPPPVLQGGTPEVAVIGQDLQAKLLAAVEGKLGQGALAKAMDGVDGRLIHAAHRQAQGAGGGLRVTGPRLGQPGSQEDVIRLRRLVQQGQGLDQPGADAPAQLVGSGLGEGHHQQVPYPTPGGDLA